MSKFDSKELISNFVDFMSKSPEERIQIMQLLGKVKCPFCGKDFDKEEDLLRHINQEHPGEEPEEFKLP